MSENVYTILLNKTWIGIGLADKMQGIKTIGRLAYKKDIFYTEQRLSLDMYFLGGGISTLDNVTQVCGCKCL